MHHDDTKGNKEGREEQIFVLFAENQCYEKRPAKTIPRVARREAGVTTVSSFAFYFQDGGQ